MQLPTLGQLKTFGAYLLVIGTGAFIGYTEGGVVGAIILGLAAIPVSMMVGLVCLFMLAELLGYSSRETNKEEA